MYRLDRELSLRIGHASPVYRKLKSRLRNNRAHFYSSEVPGLPSHCAGCYIVVEAWTVIQCANSQTASVRDKTFKINHGHLLEGQSQQWWGAKESWAAIFEIHSNTDESNTAWPPRKDGSWTSAPTDPVFPAYGRKAEPRKAQAVV